MGELGVWLAPESLPWVWALLLGAGQGACFALGLALLVRYAATPRDDQGFNALFRFGITPLFLFSGTFFPVAQLPFLLQVVAWATPLYHGVALARSLALGYAVAEPLATGLHLAYLVALTALGAALAVRTFRRRLEH